MAPKGDALPTLTKSRYLSGLHCQKRLWLEAHRPEAAAPRSAFAAFLLAQGNEIGQLARQRYPDGVRVPWSHDPDAMVAATRATLQGGAQTVFEAAFRADGALVLIDVLRRNPDNTYRLIEVKSGTKVKDEHLHDLAVQWHVAQRAGLDVDGVSLLRVNSACTHPELWNLFQLEDLSARVRPLLDGLPQHLARFTGALGAPQPPEVSIGRHCRKPEPCPFLDHCWAFTQGRPVVFDLPRLSESKLQALQKTGALYLDELPDGFPLTPGQQAYLDKLNAPQIEIAAAGLAKKLAKLRPPLHFLDFETFGHAVPRFPGMRPYEHFPFQFSCHVLHADGRLEHRHYLHQTEDDPRRPLARALLEAIGPKGSLIAYFAAFERGVLRGLAHALPDLAPGLNTLAERLWDQYAAVKGHIDHPGFNGSYSLKAVLPVLVPNLSYAGLAVGKGDEAQAAWHELVHGNGKRRGELAKALEAYCTLDTLAMVEIHRVLAQTQE